LESRRCVAIFAPKAKDVKEIEIALGLARHSEARVRVAGLTDSLPRISCDLNSVAYHKTVWKRKRSNFSKRHWRTPVASQPIAANFLLFFHPVCLSRGDERSLLSSSDLKQFDTFDHFCQRAGDQGGALSIFRYCHSFVKRQLSWCEHAMCQTYDSTGPARRLHAQMARTAQCRERGVFFEAHG
jgi:hypothetical protein